MCVMSMVYDYWNKKIPDNIYIQPQIQPVQQPGYDLQELRRLIADFKKAIEAARVVDKLTGQPDCEDLDKAKLSERVEKLEKELASLKRKKKCDRQQ